MANTSKPTLPDRWVGIIVVGLVVVGAVAIGLLKARQSPQDARVATGPAGTSTATSAPRLRTFVAAADAKVDAANPNDNYGSRPTLRVDAKPMVRSYLRFEVRRLPGKVRSAVLQVWANSRQRPGYQVHRLGGVPWSEATSTFANQPTGAIDATRLGSSGPVTASSWTSVDVTALLDGGEGTRSLVLQTTGATGLSLASREDTTHAPRLVVETG